MYDIRLNSFQYFRRLDAGQCENVLSGPLLLLLSQLFHLNREMLVIPYHTRWRTMRQWLYTRGRKGSCCPRGVCLGTYINRMTSVKAAMTASSRCKPIWRRLLCLQTATHCFGGHSQQVPVTLKLARNHLCAKNDTSVFSSAGNIVSWKRAAFDSDHVDRLVFLANNI